MKKLISIILSMILMTVVMTSCNTKEEQPGFGRSQTEQSYTTTIIQTTTQETTTTTVYEEVKNDYDYLTYYWTDSASYVIEDLKSQGYKVLNNYADLVTLSSEYAGAKILDYYYNIRIWFSGDTVNGIEIIILYDDLDKVATFDNAYNLLEDMYGVCEHYYASTEQMTIDEFYTQYHNNEYKRGFTFGYVWYKSDHTAVGVYAEGYATILIKYYQYTPEPELPDTTYNNDYIL